MVDMDSRQLLWVQSLSTDFSGALASGTWQDATLIMVPGATGTAYHAGPYHAHDLHRHWMIESVVFRFWDDDASDNSDSTWTLAFFSASNRLPASIDSSPTLGFIEFAGDAGKATVGNADGVTYWVWEDHDIHLPYFITDSPTYSSLYLSLKHTGANARDATDDTAVMIGLRPLDA